MNSDLLQKLGHDLIAGEPAPARADLAKEAGATRCPSPSLTAAIEKMFVLVLSSHQRLRAVAGCCPARQRRRGQSVNPADGHRLVGETRRGNTRSGGSCSAVAEEFCVYPRLTAAERVCVYPRLSAAERVCVYPCLSAAERVCVYPRLSAAERVCVYPCLSAA